MKIPILLTVEIDPGAELLPSYHLVAPQKMPEAMLSDINACLRNWERGNPLNLRNPEHLTLSLTLTPAEPSEVLTEAKLIESLENTGNELRALANLIRKARR